MSDRTRRRFLADLLFAGGAVTAASVLGYVATHQRETVAAQPTPAAPETPAACTPNVDMRPAGEMEAPRPAPSVATPEKERAIPVPRQGEMQPPGLVAVPREQQGR